MPNKKAPDLTKRTKPLFAFFDVENVRNSVEEYGYIDLNYPKIIGWLKNKRSVSRIYLYASAEPGDTIKKKKYLDLQKIPGCYVSIKRIMAYKQKPWPLETICPSCQHSFVRKIYIKDHKKGNCDAEMTLDIVRFGVRKKYSGIIVFSGDGDFARVYEYVAEELKKPVILFAPDKVPGKKRTSSRLKKLANNGTIKLESLKGLMFHYGQKEE
ncbi:MAG TPA: NYN domain-containing protein [Patescibacteria group bacterium]|nr:NYN domain-containing protein [Patescibacteria group bacterium]